MQSHDANAIHAICNPLQQRLANRAFRTLHANTNNWCSRGVRETCDSRADAAASGNCNRIIV
eukprot:10506722-Lingulodinium_polyedra.AAC.1